MFVFRARPSDVDLGGTRRNAVDRVRVTAFLAPSLALNTRKGLGNQLVSNSSEFQAHIVNNAKVKRVAQREYFRIVVLALPVSVRG